MKKKYCYPDKIFVFNYKIHFGGNPWFSTALNFSLSTYIHKSFTSGPITKIEKKKYSVSLPRIMKHRTWKKRHITVRPLRYTFHLESNIEIHAFSGSKRVVQNSVQHTLHASRSFTPCARAHEFTPRIIIQECKLRDETHYYSKVHTFRKMCFDI